MNNENEELYRRVWTAHFVAAFLAANPQRTPSDAIGLARVAWQELERERDAWAASEAAAPAAVTGPQPQAGSNLALDPVREKHRNMAEALASGLRGTLVSWGTREIPSEPVRAFQRELGLEPDGVAGVMTRAAARELGVELPERPQ